MTTEQMARMEREMGKVQRDLKTVESRYGEDVLQLSDRLRLLSRPMRLEEGMDLAHRQGNPLFGFFPREHAHFGFRREHRALHSDGVRVGRDIVRQDQNRGLATT